MRSHFKIRRYFVTVLCLVPVKVREVALSIALSHGRGRESTVLLFGELVSDGAQKYTGPRTAEWLVAEIGIAK
jgi:hypothetical protein